VYLLNVDEPRRKAKIFALAKFFSELGHVRQFLDGDLFMRRLSHYGRQEDAEGRWDATEGVWAWLQKQGLEIALTVPRIGVANITERACYVSSRRTESCEMSSVATAAAVGARHPVRTSTC
jgi:hypothetical protein